MTRYVVLYHAPLAVAQRFAEATPEEAQLGVQAWIDWTDKLGGALIDPGQPLGQSRRVTTDGVSLGTTDIIGMSIIQASSMEDAILMVKDHHHLAWSADCSITVLEEMPIPELTP
ncbi:hypothetical protein GCM10028798_36320 [Humibacter antri]